MKLILDIGNTSVKAALYDGSTIIRKARLADAGSKAVESFLADIVPGSAIISTVSNDASDIEKYLNGRIPMVHSLSWRSVLPFSIDYDTPETLGADRLAAAAGAVMHHPGHDLLIIDAGSAITFDLVTGGVYRGGSISPGMSMRFRALHRFTGKLPEVSQTEPFSLPGRSTREAIAGGVITGIVFETREYINLYRKTYGSLQTVITGGDAGIIASHIDYELIHYPDLVTDGLSYLLDLNINKI